MKTFGKTHRTLALTSSLLLGLLAHGSSSALAAPAKPAAPSSAKPAPTISTSGVGPAIDGFSLWGIVAWNGVGVGGRYLLSLPIEQLLPGQRFRDRFALEFGADLLHYTYSYYAYRGYYGYSGYGDRYDYGYSWTQVQPVLGVMWNVWFNDRFVLYPKTDIGYGIGVRSGWDDRWNGRPGHGGIDVNFGLGAMFKTRRLTLRSEVGLEGIRFGIAWL